MVEEQRKDPGYEVGQALIQAYHAQLLPSLSLSFHSNQTLPNMDIGLKVC